MDDNKKEFYVDFSGYISVEAKNAEEAERLFWGIFWDKIWDKIEESASSCASIDIDSIEEA